MVWWFLLCGFVADYFGWFGQLCSGWVLLFSLSLFCFVLLCYYLRLLFWCSGLGL